jgi:hypothetical protein
VWPGYEKRPIDRQEELGTYEKLLVLDETVLEMPRLTTVEERKQNLTRSRRGIFGVPLERTPRLNRAIAEERKAVGYRN